MTKTGTLALFCIWLDTIRVAARAGPELEKINRVMIDTIIRVSMYFDFVEKVRYVVEVYKIFMFGELLEVYESLEHH